MDIVLRIRLESADGELVWWADAPAVPGFYVANPSLVLLQDEALLAIADTLDVDPDSVVIQPRFVEVQHDRPTITPAIPTTFDEGLEGYTAVSGFAAVVAA